MQIVLKEHELETALERYFQGVISKPVRVIGFDLSGMRSKDGLSASIELEIIGETDTREPKGSNSVNVHTTNTAWRINQDTEESVEHVLEGVTKANTEKLEVVLDLLINNPRDVNKSKILELVELADEETLQVLDKNPLYQAFCNRLNKTEGTSIEAVNLFNDSNEPKEDGEPQIITHQDASKEVTSKSEQSIAEPHKPSEDSSIFFKKKEPVEQSFHPDNQEVEKGTVDKPIGQSIKFF